MSLVSITLFCSTDFQSPPLLGIENYLQVSHPVLSNAASLTGRLYNFSSVSGPDITPAWLMLSVSNTSFQSPMDSAYLYQHYSITMSSEVTGQSYISNLSGNTVVPLYPSLPANFVQGTMSQILNQGHSLSFPYQKTHWSLWCL
jgi:hypothetical protein